jgi:predicted lactoylglutathione lyase
MSRLLFVNLPVRDLNRSKAFFSKLGFSFDSRFTDEKAACMVFNDGAYAMLLVEPFFKSFMQRELFDNQRQTETLLAFSAGSRSEVDALANIAEQNGGRAAGEPQDHGFMYQRSFYDLDGHHWEVMWMEPKVAEAGLAGSASP